MKRTPNQKVAHTENAYDHTQKRDEMKLADFVEQISDDFHSTFTVVQDDTLMNMMGLPGDFESIEKIIKRYLPNARVMFQKTNELGTHEPYDIYLVRAVTPAAKRREPRP